MRILQAKGQMDKPTNSHPIHRYRDFIMALVSKRVLNLGNL